MLTYSYELKIKANGRGALFKSTLLDMSDIEENSRKEMMPK